MSHTYTDTKPIETLTDRNPDVDVESGEIPAGCYIHRGNYLQRYAKIAKVPFGIAWEKTKDSWGKKKTVGLVIRESDRKTLEAQLAKPKRYQPEH